VTAGGLPPDEFGPTYAVLLEEIEGDVRAARARARRTVTGELVGLYWRIGNRILDRQASQGWGAKVIDRLAADLKAAFPDSRGFSRSNLEYMRRLAASHPDPGFPQQPAGELPWGHWMVLLDKLSADPDLQRWYAAQAVEHAVVAVSLAAAMPVEFLTDDQVGAYGRVPAEPSRAQVERWWHFDDADRGSDRRPSSSTQPGRVRRPARNGPDGRPVPRRSAHRLPRGPREGAGRRRHPPVLPTAEDRERAVNSIPSDR